MKILPKTTVKRTQEKNNYNEKNAQMFLLKLLFGTVCNSFSHIVSNFILLFGQFG